MRRAAVTHTSTDTKAEAGGTAVRIEYLCRHCHHMVGEIDRPDWSYEDAVQILGLGHLDEVERARTIAYNDHGRWMYILTVCDYCQQAVEAHPELLVEGKLLQ